MVSSSWFKQRQNLFLVGLFGAFTLVVGFIITFNVLIDPYFIRTKRLQGVNDEFGVLPTWDIRLTYKVQRKDGVTTSIVGTSNVLYGLSNCNGRGYERISASGAHLEETIPLGLDILQSRSEVSTVFIEVSRSQVNSSDIKLNWLERNLNLSTLKLALKTAWASALNEVKIDSCYNTYALINRTVPNVHILQQQHSKYGVLNKADLSAIKNADWATVNRLNRDEKPKIVFFISPIPQELLAVDPVQSNFAASDKLLTGLVEELSGQYANIVFEYINLNNHHIGVSYQFKFGNFHEGWYDSNHYKSVIGDEVVDFLLKD